MEKHPLHKIIQVVSIATLGGAILFGVHFLREVLLPFVLAFLLAYLLDPWVIQFQRFGKSRVVSVLGLLGSIGLSIGILVIISIPILKSEIKDVGFLLQDIWQNPSLQNKLHSIFPNEIVDQIKIYIQKQDWIVLLQKKEILTLFQKGWNFLLPQTKDLVFGTVHGISALFGVVIVLLYLIFMLVDYDTFRKECTSLIPVSWQAPLFSLWNDFDFYMSRYFRAQAGVAAIVGICFALGFSIIGLPMAILLGVFIGVLNMVPYLQMLALPPALFLALVEALASGSNPWMAMMYVILVFAIVQVIQDAYLTPKIMGKVTGLSPALLLLSISVWGKVLGFLGVIIALPLTCIVLAYYKNFLKQNPSSKSR